MIKIGLMNSLKTNKIMSSYLKYHLIGVLTILIGFTVLNYTFYPSEHLYTNISLFLVYNSIVCVFIPFKSNKIDENYIS